MGYTRLYVGRIPRDTTEREIRRHFDEFGRLRDIRILVGFAFVEYSDERDARDAVDRLDGSRFLGERITVEPARAQARGERRERSERPRGKFRILVDNLPGRTSWQTLKDLMRKAGEVVFTDVDRDGVGIVEFVAAADMEEALKMFDDYDYEGKRLRVKEDRSEASSSSRRDRSRSPRRDRSRSPAGGRTDDRRNGSSSSRRKDDDDDRSPRSPRDRDHKDDEGDRRNDNDGDERMSKRDEGDDDRRND